MRLLQIEAHDFAQFDDLSVDMSTFDQAVIVGENGKGKSMLMDMTVWCLTGRGTERVKSTDTMIRDDHLGMWVRTTWDRSGEKVVIQRSRSVETKAGESVLVLTVDGVSRSKHAIPETQAEIEQLVGLDRDQILAGPFMEQGESDKLMRLDPAPRKSLFGSLCGADKFGPAHEAAKAWRDQHIKEVVRLEGLIPMVRARVDREVDLTRERDEAGARRTTAAAAVNDLVSVIETLRTEAATLREQALRAESLSTQLTALNREDEGLTTEQATVADSMVRLERESRDPIAEPVLDPLPELELATVLPDLPLDLDAVAVLETDAAKLPAAQRTLATLEAELAHSLLAHDKATKEGLCDRCPYRGKELTEADRLAMVDRVKAGKDWVVAHEGDAAAATAMRNQSATRAVLVKQAVEFNAGAEARHAEAVTRTQRANTDRQLAYQTAVEARARAGADLKAQGARLVTITDRRAAIAEETSGIQAERLRLIQTDDRAREVAEEMTTKAEQLTAARGFLSDAERAHAVAESTLADVAKARTELVDLNDQWTKAKAEVDAHELVVKMFHRDGLPTMIVEATIPMVEARANELLERMPGELSVTLVTQKQTKKGTWSDTLDIEVSEGGRDRAYGMLSGAERFRVDLALRLGLSSVLLHRSGSKFETLWLDEPFSAQDRRALESLLQSVAAVVDEFGLTLVVTHQQEVAERFPVRLEVSEVSFGVSKVEVAA